ncbi:MAG: neuraminidase-like domain-containing protein [Vicinamibacterales bacterium]|jgi:hypothetical protein
MNPVGEQTVRGFVADSDTGTGRGGLRVELWRANGHHELVATTESDAAGAFHVPFILGAGPGDDAPRDIEVRVRDGDELLLSEMRELAGVPFERLELYLPTSTGPDDALPAIGLDQDGPGHHQVSGRVKGTVQEGSTVRVVLTSLSDHALVEQVVGEAAVDDSGRYQADYQPLLDDAPRDTSLSVRLYSPDGDLVATSAPVLGPPPQAAVNLRPRRDWSAEPSEYALLEGRVASTLAAGVDGLDAAESAVIDEVSEWLDVDAERLALLQQSRALARDTGVPAEAFYALGRNGMDVSLGELLDAPRHELRTTLEEAVADRIIDGRSLGSIEATVEQLSSAIIDHAIGAEHDSEGSDLAAILAAADIPRESIAQVLRRYQDRSVGGWPPWEISGPPDESAEAAGEALDPDVEIAVRLSELVGADPALLRRLHERRRDGQWQALDDLSALSFDDWCELVEDTAPFESDANDGETDAEAEAEYGEAVEDRAEAILDTLEEAFPSPFIRKRLADSEDIGAPARQVIARATAHDFHHGSIRERVAAEPALVEGLTEADAEAAIEDIEAVERVSRVADRADEVALLVGTGMRSAMEIAATPRGHFIEAYGEALGGRAQASRVHAQAQQAAAGSKLASVRLLQATQHAPLVMGVKGVPDARDLFQAPAGFCECEHCGSVYSPAAYFVDLLRYLNVSAPDRRDQIAKRLAPAGSAAATAAGSPSSAPGPRSPLDVLLARRPDLAHLPLTCENTLTALPYIDLVNELLEAAITGGSAAFDTGKTPGDVLRAVPQNLSAAAYLELQQAVHPLALPYHQPLALARAYLGHLGVSRLELMRALGRGDAARDAVTWESLGMSPEEFALVAAPPAELWKHLGFAAEQVEGATFVDVLARVPVMLDATGLTFARLVDLVSTRFVNGDDRLRLESPAPDCDPEKIRLTGLDADRVSRMVRVIRLQRRLGWTFPVLDRALVAIGAADLDAAVLSKLAAIKDVAARLDRPVEELLVLWAPIQAWGANSQFDKLFTTRAVAWRTEDTRTFQLRPDRTELATVGPSLDAVSSALLAAFRITSDELSLIRALHARRGTEPRLDLAGLSAIYRVVVLSRSLQLRIPALDLLLRLVPADADPFRPGDPAATARFIDLVREVQATDFTPERLAYLFRHEWEPRRDPGPLPAQVDAVLAGIRQGLADAFAETSLPAEVSTETLRQKLAMLLDQALLDPALEALDPRTPLDAARRRSFFDRHLARIFADPAAAAARLLEPPPADLAREALELRWKAHIHFVLEHLLPRLRSRQVRGAVVQSLSDTMGMSVPATARLLDEVMRSRRAPGEPMLADFLAMLGTGLTGEYFATPDLQGTPVVTRIDPGLTFAWAGAAPADGVPGRQFSARWTGHLLARAKGAHTFYLQTDGAVRLSLVVDGKERVVIDKPESGGKPVEHVSEPLALDPRQLVAIRLEYRNQGAPATLALQMGTGPVARQPVPTPQLYPANGLSSFAPVEQSYRRLHKAAMIVSGFGTTDAHLEWLSRAPAFLNLDGLPMEPAADAAPHFQRWRQLAAIYAVRKTLPRSNADLFDVFLAANASEALDRLVLVSGWDRGVVEALVGPDGFAADPAHGLRPPVDPGEVPLVVRLARAVDVQRRTAVAPATLQAWANAAPDADVAATVVQAVKSRYDETRWLEVARTLNDPLRAERRDALVACLLPRLRPRGITNRNQLFEYFLIDVDMNPCMLTSRIRQATGAVQTFFQRCLMNLEPQVPPRVIADADWKWLKNYRVWEANRKVFLYPENWIEPELRDDKSPLFQALESTILQQEIKNDNVEAAFADYLEGLDEVARLDVRGVWFEERDTHRMVTRPAPAGLGAPPPPPRSPWPDGTYHVFARTFNAPHLWYYRRLERGRQWTAWEKIDADIEGEHLVPVIFNRRMHLFWTLFREVNKPLPPMDRESKGAPQTVGKDWEIQLAYTVYDRGRWSRKRVSTQGVVDYQTFVTVRPYEKDRSDQVTHRMVLDGSRVLTPSDYTLRASIGPGALPQLRLHLYSRAVERARLERLVLVPAEVEPVATFFLNGCNGELVPDQAKAVRRAKISRHTKPKRSIFQAHIDATLGNVRSSGRSQPFRLTQGGMMNAPAGYQVSGMGLARARHAGGALLTLPTADRRGAAVALPQARNPLGTRIVPVTNPANPDERGLFPFFFQDRFRSYFVRPVYAHWTPPTPVAAPLFARRFGLGKVVRPGRRAPVRARRGGRGRREAFDEGFDEQLPVLDLEAQDMWDADQDEAWHPDDAAEARPRRRRQKPAPPRPGRRPAAPARRAPARPAPVARLRSRPRVQPGYHEYKLQFTPFEHPQTCHFIRTLKAKGIDGLLDLATTRPLAGVDHVRGPDGTWQRRGRSWFQQHYGLGPLVDTGKLPHLDVDFDHENAYALYNWELFFHAPLQVALRLAKDGRHEEAQRWFHFIFDPTTDSRAPSPRRYWRFAPFHTNSEYEGAREMMQLLSSYEGSDPATIAKQRQVREQLLAWWEKPFSPHVIARLRIAAYQKAVLMKYIDNLIEWGDKLFRRDSMESIQEATQIYILAANILGPRPEQIPPIVTRAPMTFEQMRRDLNLFSNVEVRMENLQVRRPFRINARPDTSGVSSVLSMATQYFCTPPNPQLDKYWDTVADRLFKIRNCMNIQGIVRQLPLFEPPIDPGLLVRAAAAGVDLGSVVASLNAPPPHYRFRFLLARAVRLAEEIRSFGAMTLKVLESRDAEGLASLRASNEVALLDALRDVRKKQVRQVEEALAELGLQREHLDMQMQHLNTQLTQLMNPQELASQKSLSAAQVISGVAEGVDLVAKVMHAIPEFQTGAAGGFSSPFVTLQLGGQMFGDIAEAFAASLQKVMSKNETEADLAAAQAEYQRRREEWQHELELLQKEKGRIDKKVAETQLTLEIASADLRRHDLEVDNSRKVQTYLRDKYTNQQLYGWMLGQLSGVYFQGYKVAFDAAQHAERAFRFDRGDQSSSFIEFSYWDSLKKGLFAGERLLVDLRRMEAAHIEGDRRALEITRHISLRDDYPAAFLELLATGRCQIEASEALLDGDFPGHYFRRLKTVSLTMTGAVAPQRNVNCTLTLLESRVRTSANASGAYARSADGEDSRFTVNPIPIHAVATSRPDGDAGVFHLRFDDERLLPFEGAGAVSTWRIDLPQADNALDLAQLTDLVLTLAYTARTGGAALEAAARAEREKGLARGGITPEPRQFVSLKRDFPLVWKQLQDAAAGQDVEAPLALGADRFSGRYRGLDLRIERAALFALAGDGLRPEALRVRIDPPKGSGAAVSGWAAPWPRARMLRATAEVSGPPGPWKLAVGAEGAKVPDVLDDLVIVFDLRARKK